MAIGANIGECAPITTDYVWRARDNGAKLIVADPRFTPIARNADLFLPVRPGTDLALLMAMLHVIIRDGLTDGDFIAAHTTGFEKTAESVEPWNPRRAAEVTGVAPDAIERAAHWIGESRRASCSCTRVASSTTPRASRIAKPWWPSRWPPAISGAKALAPS